MSSVLSPIPFEKRHPFSIASSHLESGLQRSVSKPVAEQREVLHEHWNHNWWKSFQGKPFPGLWRNSSSKFGTGFQLQICHLSEYMKEKPLAEHFEQETMWNGPFPHKSVDDLLLDPSWPALQASQIGHQSFPEGLVNLLWMSRFFFLSPLLSVHLYRALKVNWLSD